ncbi:MAG: hypothetical protein RMM58_14060 [Chloroflexota bacterium]|nr:hypothetical protein [Dehalococcoidia bacterium]MDW8254997.1 hypothetical protein [Chloroflexota bacterium]
MGLLDRLFGRPSAQQAPSPPPAGAMTDQQAIARYRYLLQTAPPEAIEQAHQEAFAKLTPEQRELVRRELNAVVPPHEQATKDDPATLARVATRAEMRQPGTLERAFGGRGPGLGTMIGASLLSSIAGAFIGTMIAQQLLSGFGDPMAMAETGPLADAGASDPGDDSLDAADFGFGDFEEF